MLDFKQEKVNKMTECLYLIDKKRYDEFVAYMRSRGTVPYCGCQKCRYYARRIAAKGEVVKEMYETPMYQATLRSLAWE